VNQKFEWPVLTADSRANFVFEEEALLSTIKIGMHMLTLDNIPCSTFIKGKSLEKWDSNITDFETAANLAYVYAKEEAHGQIENAKIEGYVRFEQTVEFIHYDDCVVLSINNILKPSDMKKTGSITYAGAVKCIDNKNIFFSVSFQSEEESEDD